MSALISDFLADCELRNLSPATIRAYWGDLKRVLGKSDPVKMTRNKLARRLADLKISARSRARHMASLRAFYRWATITGVIETDPTIGLPAIKIGKHLPTVLEQDELTQFMEAIKAAEGCHAGRDYALFSILFGAGLRISEALSLPLDVPANGTLLVTGKGNKQRRAPVTPPMRAALDAYVPGDRAVIENRLFPLTRQGVSNLIAKYSRLAGIDKHFSPHACRHTFAYLAYGATNDLRAVQELLGHEDISTTQIYAKLSDKSKTETAAAVKW